MTPEQHSAWIFCEDLDKRAKTAQNSAEAARAAYIKTFRTIPDEAEVDVQDPELTGRFFVSDAVVDRGSGKIVYFVSTKDGTTQLFRTAEQMKQLPLFERTT